MARLAARDRITDIGMVRKGGANITRHPVGIDSFRRNCRIRIARILLSQIFYRVRNKHRQAKWANGWRVKASPYGMG